MFTICVSCDRGQRYCSEQCRTRARQRQVREAGRRYQQSEAGRASHRHRQQQYRERQAVANVTHQGRQLDINPVRLDPPSLSRCTTCGLQSRWIDPFPLIPRRLRRRRRPKNYVFR